MWELQVHEDGDAEIRRVPLSHRNDGTILLFKDSDSLIAELSSYGIHDDAAIEEAMQRAEGHEYKWVKV